MTPFWYNLLLAMIVPLYRWRIWQRSRHLSDYRNEVQQRFGLEVAALADRTLRKTIWIHAVSLGETNAAQPIIQHLLTQQYTVLVTNTTRTGQARTRQLFADQVISVFLPVDTVALMNQFFDRYHPQVIGLIETELWPNLLAIAHQRNIATVLLNARLSAKSARGYARFSALTRPMLQHLNAIAAQDADTAARFVALGAPVDRVQVTGSLKFDLQPPASALQLAAQLKQQWNLASRNIVLIASSHDPEENQLLNIFKALYEQHPSVCLIVVPRHPERFGAVAQLIQDKGWPLRRRSLGQGIDAETAVYLADSMGELWTWYALADMAFIGGSLAMTGGHNPLEAARLAVPMVMGEHTFNFAQIVENLKQSGALVQVADASAVYRVWHDWLQQPMQAMQAGQAGQQFLHASQGALARQLALLDGLIAAVAPDVPEPMCLNKP